MWWARHAHHIRGGYAPRPKIVYALPDRIEAQCHAAGEAVLPLRLERMELRGVQIAQQPLQTEAPEEPAAANGFERFLDAGEQCRIASQMLQ